MLKQNAECLLQNWVTHVKARCTLLITKLGGTSEKTKNTFIITKWICSDTYKDKTQIDYYKVIIDRPMAR